MGLAGAFSPGTAMPGDTKACQDNQQAARPQENKLFCLDSSSLILTFYFTIVPLQPKGQGKKKREEKILGKKTQHSLAAPLAHRKLPPQPWLPGARFQMCVDKLQLQSPPCARSCGRGKAPPLSTTAALTGLHYRHNQPCCALSACCQQSRSCQSGSRKDFQSSDE